MTTVGVGSPAYVDDTTPIQNAISAAIDGSIVYFPEGTYALSNQLLVSGKPLRLMGDGVGTRLEAITAFPASTAILKLDANGVGVEGMSISDLLFNPESSGGASDVILISSSSGTFTRLELARLTRQTTGEVQLWNGNPAHVISLDGICFVLD